MHDTAAAFGAAFFRCYADAIEGARILEVGAGDVNGTLRGCAPHHSKYTGIDLVAGPGVDVVLSDPYTYPFEPATYDIVVSSSCLEHDQMFWLSFLEMCRVLREGGFIYLNVPSNGAFHRYPTDNWRFYPDSGLALVSWGRRNGHNIRLVESFIGRRRRDVWNDCVMVFGKGDTPRQLSLIAELFPRSLNIRVGDRETFSNYCEQTEDMTLQAWVTQKLGLAPTSGGNENQTIPFGTLLMSLAEREVALDATERAAAERSAAAQAQIAALRDEVAAREAALAAATAGLQRAEAELDERGAALQRAEQQIIDERDNQADVLETVRAELASARSALADRDGAAMALAGTLGRRDAALAEAQNELESLRSAARHSGQQHADAVDRLRRSVASLQHEAEERTAAIAAMQAELQSIRNQLAAARQVSRSLLAALRAGPVVTPVVDEPVRHRRGIFHLIRLWARHARL